MKGIIKKSLLILGVFLFIAGNVWALYRAGDTVHMEANPDKKANFSGGEFLMTDFSVFGFDIQIENIIDKYGNHAQSQIVGSATPVPEPASIFLFGTGLIGLAGIGRKRLRNN